MEKMIFECEYEYNVQRDKESEILVSAITCVFYAHFYQMQNQIK